jgi:hypothetical protein
MNVKKIRIIFIALTLLLTLVSCRKEPSYEDRETFPKETYVPVADGGIVLYDGITKEELSAVPSLAEWLSACAASDRNDYFGGYMLRHESTEGENTVFTYLVYYPHGEKAMAVYPELLEGTSGYVLNLGYTAGEGVDGYSICYLTVTLPTDTDRAPRVRLVVGNQTPGVVITVTDSPIPAPKASTVG